MKLEINHKKSEKFTNVWRLNSALEQPMDQQRNQRRNQKNFETNEKEIQHIKIYGTQQKQF